MKTPKSFRCAKEQDKSLLPLFTSCARTDCRVKHDRIAFPTNAIPTLQDSARVLPAAPPIKGDDRCSVAEAIWIQGTDLQLLFTGPTMRQLQPRHRIACHVSRLTSRALNICKAARQSAAWSARATSMSRRRVQRCCRGTLVRALMAALYVITSATR